jgi:hypothetical protein
MNKRAQTSGFTASEALWRAAIVVTVEAQDDTIRSFVHLPNSLAPIEPLRPLPKPARPGVPLVVVAILAIASALAGAALGLAFYHVI